MKKKIRVLIVDDSAVVRQTLSDILSSDPAIEVMATAGDPYVAADRMREEIPDVAGLEPERAQLVAEVLRLVQRPLPDATQAWQFERRRRQQLRQGCRLFRWFEPLIDELKEQQWLRATEDAQDFVLQPFDLALRPAPGERRLLGEDAGAEDVAQQRNHRSAPE